MISGNAVIARLDCGSLHTDWNEVTPGSITKKGASHGRRLCFRRVGDSGNSNIADFAAHETPARFGFNSATRPGVSAVSASVASLRLAAGGEGRGFRRAIVRQFCHPRREGGLHHRGVGTPQGVLGAKGALCPFRDFLGRPKPYQLLYELVAQGRRTIHF
jgi:hypothetical protein